ncbi:cupin domain-containing protein [Prosthecochloris sp. SCSIO W1101]|uniref:cupin domain-containing protein n=1 Tax=Prosthecochloris sp. SCSIO W1101 TaxID=2992242 RepID=UPI00223D1374|nr:cupin domain-containing protein [Prosthecochloris sp. SCSIO W1101]UZJ40429.1 cupin domain-containing protein [Prosthecochloris sp. SCSIO W1101]
MIRNVFSSLPEDVSQEVVEDLVRSSNVRIERIVSYGHSSPETGWYDQDESEWVIVLDGSGSLLFENGREIVLRAGDYIDIPAHTRHKVLWTDKDRPTIWLAVFYT